MKKLISLSVSAICAVAMSACGPKAFVKGDYDDNVEDTNLLTDKWSETDMQVAVKDLVDSATKAEAVTAAKKTPIVMVTRVQNKTDEHIDTQNITDMMRVELGRNSRVKFVDKEAREDIKEEYDYQNSGMVGRETQKGPGGQIGADFILNGRLDSIVQQAGKDKTVYYKLTMNLTNLKTGVIEWSDYKQLRKLFKKKRVGL